MSLALLLASCSADDVEMQDVPQRTLQFSTSVQDFEGESRTRTNVAGTAFDNGDKIKLKIICPKSAATELGESTDGASFDGFWLLKWKKDSTKWVTIESGDGYDINGDYSPSNGPNVFERYLAQPILYVFTAQTWSEEQIFLVGKENGTRVEQYSNVFHADQSDSANYKACDVMWAQTIMQTGTYNIHLSFKHVMSALMINVEGTVSDNAVLTLEGVPDIDQAEVIVGDYYASESKANLENYGYKKKNACDKKEQNGTVIGVAQINNGSATTAAISSISQKGTYTALKVNSNTYRLIVPPCSASNLIIWLRDGNKRYKMVLDEKEFMAGKLHKVTMKI